MANNIGWGQAAANNAIGWGQAAINNLISWGASYYSSPSGETDILGSPVPGIITAFKARATSLNCTFEAESCLTTTLNNLNT